MIASGDYRDLLLSAFTARRNRNSSYSLRAFSRDLGVSASRISEILNRKRGLSVVNAARIADRLGMDREEKELFILMVEAKHARSSSLKEHAQKKIKALENQKEIFVLQADLFSLVSDWYHNAILELLDVEEAKATATWMAKRLGISVLEVESALERLARVGLLEKRNGKFVATHGFSSSYSNVPSKAFRMHHEQILEKAKQAVWSQEVGERALLATTVAVDSKDLKAVEEKMRKFSRTLTADLKRRPKKNRVYCLSMQFFGLDQKEKEQ